MKAIILFIVTLLLIGCNSTKDNTLIVPAEGELYNKNNIVLFGYIPNFTFLDRYPKTQIISSKDKLNQLIDDLNEAPVLENGNNDNGINKEIKSKWLNAINSVNIDFEKSNLFVLRFTTGRIYDIKISENDIKGDKKIIFTIANPEDMAAMSDAGYIFIYKVPKNVENITIELFPSTQNAEKFTVKNI